MAQPLIQEGHLEQAAQHHALVASEDLQEGDSTNSLGKLCQCSITPTQHKRVTDIQREPSVCQFVPTATCPSTGQPSQEPGSVLFAASLHVFILTHELTP